ncbi:thioester-containing protein 1 allele R1-like [Diorhabda carinulata]|uniref:thioester-containing protein 1 allele R1-like n=1 Tax=Diorhabda carinulata TaxID=1163345 RepID=UPI0025A2FE42|nr:thioester-containing protein 1 allele R1-like [Diorhabda carinulata]
MDGVLLVFCAIILLVHNVSSQIGYYNVVGPRVIRPNSTYRCAVSVDATSQPTTITAVLRGTSHSSTPLFIQDQIVVQPYSTNTCELQVIDIQDGDYELEVSGSGGIDFITGYPLQYLKKSYNILIQTDKQVYEPGSTIIFRALLLNAELKPAPEVKNEFVHIFVTDGSGNIVRDWKRVEAIRGVFTNELKISKSPVLGKWNISVEIHEQIYNKTIEVAEYVLPKFIVNIESKKHITFNENIIRAKIESKYYSGDNVKGEATITMYPTIFSGVIQPIFQNPIRKVFQIDGTGTVEFDIEKDLRLNDEYERIVVIDVAIEEQFTGRRQNNSMEVHIHKYDYHMDLIKTSDYFKPGLKYTAYVQVSNHDGSPVQIKEQEVIVRHGYSRIDEIYNENKYTLDKNGFLKLEYLTPKNVTNTTALRLEVEYRDLKERSTPIPAAVSFSNAFLQVILETERPIVNLEVEITVNSTHPMKTLSYILMGRGDVLRTHTFQVENKKQFKFHFIATHAMAPVCHLIVFYVRQDGELIGDALDIEVDGALQNFVDIRPNTLESEPDLDVEFTITAQQNSYVGLMAVDENVGRLRNGYDLSLEGIAEELKIFDAGFGTPYPHFKRNSKNKLIWYPGSNNIHNAIFESGADIGTNCHINRAKPTLEDIYLRPVFYGPSTVKPDRGLGLPIHSVTRPPLAGPYAFSRIPKPVWNKPKVYLSENIADTWLFNNFSTYEGKAFLRRRLPNSLTTWSITGFSLDPLHGLGLSTSEKKIKVIKSMVVTIDLPYSVQKGEILNIPVVVRNNINEDVTVDVTLHNSAQKFDFVASLEDNNVKKVELYRRKRIKVEKNTVSSLSFFIVANKIGEIPIRVTASSPKNQDVVEKELLVLPGGETEYYTKSVLIDLRNNRNVKKSINFSIPKNVVEGSELIEVSTVGTFLGPAMIHLDDVIRLPTDCGEQNLVHLMSNLIILQYLKITGQLTPAIQNEAIKNLEIHYQQQLTYKRKDGSFSPFPWKDTTGSVWLTAYTAMALSQIKTFIYIDESVIEKTIEWLTERQNNNGSFYETGNIVHSELQNNTGNSLALTAFVVMSLRESNHRNDPITVNIINKGLDYIARNIGEEETVYTIAICGYVLQLTGHASKQSAFNLLESISRIEIDTKWWARDVPTNEEKNPWRKLPRSIDIETTSYALMTLIEANLLDDAVPVLKWLLRQQNNRGGFTSSHDTVVGLQALYKIVTRLASPTNIQIEFEYGRGGNGKFSVNKNNLMIQQIVEIEKSTREVNLTAQGTGLAVFQVSYQYNSNVTGPWPMFTLDPQVDKSSDSYHLQLSICVGFVDQNLTNSKESNMAVMEVTLPSGFTADIDALPSLELSENVQKVETRNKQTKILLYFNNLTNIEYCPTVSAYRTHKMANLKPVPVVVYDYYDSSRRARVFYLPPVTHVCDLCQEEDDCESICAAQPNAREGRQRHIGSDDGGGAKNTQICTVLIPVVIILVHLNNF